MRTALYIFLAILAAYAVISIFEWAAAFVKRVNSQKKFLRMRNYGFYGMDPWGLQEMRTRTGIILDKLDYLLEKVDQIEDSIVNDAKND